ncbi:energy transducer TonB [Dyella kyungheensis]|uniref:Energy transducer TonB n=1 Tax=Dyella kyungheensis TaxID=1242174 RepID=A0ABS2JYH7_9GAMM|nr:energy transducer TonB [Dyella kyungheensis]MBM7123537.1 energy transducer TonB [Dyella kyungheensis]
MKVGKSGMGLKMAGFLCVAGAAMAAWTAGAYAQDQTPPDQQSVSDGTKPPVHFYSLGGFAPKQMHHTCTNTSTSPDPRPMYPAQAIRQHHEGTVLVMAKVGVDGTVIDATVEQSSGYRELDESAVNATSCRKFRPKFRDGAPVISWTRVPVNFSLNKPTAMP